MNRFLVSAEGDDPTAIDAPNWLMALGMGLDRLGVVGGIDRLACEVLPNGTVIARDARRGSGFVVRPIPSDGEIPLAPAPTNGAPDAGEHVFVLGDEDDDDDEYEDVEELFALGDEEEDDVDDLDGRVDDLSDGLGPDDEPTDIGLAPALGLEPEDCDDPDTDTDEVGMARLPSLILHQRLAPVVNPRLQRIAQALSPAVAWQRALDAAQALVPSEAGSAILREADGRLRFVGATGPEAHKLTGAVLPAGTGIVGFSADRAVALIVRRPQRDPRFFGEMDRITGYATEAVLCVPVTSHGRVMGCLELLNPPPDSPFARPHLLMIERVASSLAERLEALARMKAR